MRHFSLCIHSNKKIIVVWLKLQIASPDIVPYREKQ